MGGVEHVVVGHDRDEVLAHDVGNRPAGRVRTVGNGGDDVAFGDEADRSVCTAHQRGSDGLLDEHDRELAKRVVGVGVHNRPRDERLHPGVVIEVHHRLLSTTLSLVLRSTRR